jgi:hypothetical protein
MSAIANKIVDAVPDGSSGAREIGFAVRARYNASRVLFDNIAAGRGDRLAIIGPLGQRTYAELCADASCWGLGFQDLGLQRGDRILMFLDDTPSYPAAFFGAVRAGFVPLLINTLTRPGSAAVLPRGFRRKRGGSGSGTVGSLQQYCMRRYSTSDLDRREWLAVGECRPPMPHGGIMAADILRLS